MSQTEIANSFITKDLNQDQLQAVSAQPSNLLVLAGAGSGKTRVLIHRIAWLIHNYHVSPHAILAVTFTNKAAKEMQQRMEKLVSMSVHNLWIGTFHGLAHRLLRLHWQLAGLPQTFQICDSDDQLRIIKRIHKDLNLDDSFFSPKQSQYYINNQKDNGLRHKDLPVTKDYTEKYLQEVYKIYQQQTNQLGLVDFAEILLKAKELFEANPELRQHYQNRFKHILVDEFQDTNSLQYQWLKLIHADNHYFMVGDDDQSIYGWRGAKVENIKKFCNDYPGAQVIRLEQNYRSTANILNAANNLISHNKNRLGKNLWTAGDTGEKITVYHAFNDIDESRYVVEEIKSHHRSGIDLSDMAILYRANHQSRQFEESLLQANLPYVIYGGQRFFERAEIKDALAYLRLVANPFDDAAFDRIINWPTRGIGKQSLSIIREYAQENNITLWHALDGVLGKELLKNKAKTNVSNFIDLINNCSELSKKYSLAKLMDYIINSSGLRDYYYKEDKSKDKSRVENLDELVSACSVFEEEFNSNSASDQDMTTLQAFLAHAVLESGETQAKGYEDSISLMTMHTAKGLEFKIVFIVGLEEGLFPHEMCMHDPAQLSEERRLCYVGITRAMQKLYLSFCEKRRFRGEDKYNLPSRFLQEIPPELMMSEQATTKIEPSYYHSNKFGDYNREGIVHRYNHSQTYSKSNSKSDSKFSSRNKTKLSNISLVDDQDSIYKLGQGVRHHMFGSGVVLNTQNAGDKTRVQVKFAQPHGVKWLVAEIAKLEIVK